MLAFVTVTKYQKKGAYKDGVYRDFTQELVGFVVSEAVALKYITPVAFDR